MMFASLPEESQDQLTVADSWRLSACNSNTQYKSGQVQPMVWQQQEDKRVTRGSCGSAINEDINRADVKHGGS